MNIKDRVKSLLGFRWSHVEWRDSLETFRGPGYSDPGLVSSIKAKTLMQFEAIRRNEFSIDQAQSKILIAIGRGLASKESLRVIDFGGGFGIHYFTATAIYQARFRWHVVEAAGDIDFDHHLQFFVSVAGAREQLGFVPDLVFSSGALPYTLDPYNALGELLELGSEHLYLSRLALAEDGVDLCGIQHSRLSDNGPGPLPEDMEDTWIEYPLVIPQKKVVEKMLESRFRKVVHFAEDDFFGIKQNGYFCEGRKALRRRW